MKILIVDDDEIALEALAHVLKNAGHELCMARNGREALKFLCTDMCRLVISDWVMPEMDGLELCRRIRNLDLPGYVYVMLLTSRGGAPAIVEGLTAGADDFIAKPFETDELLVRVRTGERILSLETRDVAIFAMARLAESRDPETGEHLDRMRNYCRILAQHMAEWPAYRGTITPDFVRLIYLTSPLHDIGKVGIPDSVLLKPGRLSDREFEIMKSHTTIGAETLNTAIRQYPGVAYLRLARDIALTHHERFDGSGYPSGLKASAIPLCGRLAALADVYDALTSQRIYKQAFAHEIARSMIVDEAGQHFDPHVVQAFVECEDRFVTLRNAQAVEEPALALDIPCGNAVGVAPRRGR